MKRKFSKRFKHFIRSIGVLLAIGITVPMAISTGDWTGTAFLLIIGIPIIFIKEE